MKNEAKSALARRDFLRTLGIGAGAAVAGSPPLARDAQADSPLTTLVINPARPDRIEPRVLKRRQKEYARMTKPRRALRKALLRKKRAA